MNRTWSVVSNLVFVLVPLLASCSSEPRPGLRLLGDNPAAAEGDTQDEDERLRKLQLVRVVDPDTGDALEFQLGEVDGLLAESGLCATTCDGPDPLDPPDYCAEQGGLCSAQVGACFAKLFLSVALPQAGELVVPLPPGSTYRERFPASPDFVVIPMQAPGANSGLAQQAISYAEWATSDTHYYINDLFSGFYEVEVDGEMESCLSVQPSLEIATALYADMYHTAREAFDVAVEASVAVSDAQLGSTPSTEEALGRVFSGPALSRASAAHLLVGGTPGIFGDTKWTFCTERLDPDVQAAIAVFRDAAPDPAILTDESYETDSILNDTEMAIPNGSVKQRLVSLYAEDVPSTIQEHFKLELAAFERARAYLSDEIKTFGRSLAAELPPRLTRSGQPSPYKRFAGTAARPSDSPPTLFAGVGRHLQDLQNFGSPVWPNYFRGYLNFDPLWEAGLPEAHFIDVVHSHAMDWLDKQADVPQAFRGAAMAPLALLVASGDRAGRLMFQGSWIDAHGFSPTAGLLLGVGENALRCAVEGSIEGAPCELLTTNFAVGPEPANNARVVQLHFSFQPAPGFDEVASGFMEDASRVAGRYYLLRPKRPELGVAPGNYESILAVALGTQGDPYEFTYPITPELDRRVDEILAPSPKWCAMPRMSCSGGLFDERIPLDDELASEGDGVESSWRHYLTLARTAAERADEIGQDYINSGVRLGERTEDVELRVEQQRQRADEEIAKLQKICGAAVDPRKLLALLSPGDDGQAASAALGACDEDSECMVNGEQTHRCMSGQCVVDLAGLADAHKDDPDILRIADCLKESEMESYVSLGTDPLCLWHEPNNPNVICDGATPGICPKFKRNPAETCEQVMAGHPGDVTLAETFPLEFFDSEEDDQPTDDPCAEIARARSGQPFDEARLLARRWWDPGAMRIESDRLQYRAQPLDFGAILVDGAVFAETGTPEDGPSDHWPCATMVNGMLVPPDGCTPNSSLFCRVIGECTTQANRPFFNLMMFNAVAAAKWLTLGLHPQHVNGSEFFAALDGEITLSDPYIALLKELHCDSGMAGTCTSITLGGTRVFETYLNTVLTEANWGRGFTYLSGNVPVPRLYVNSARLFEKDTGTVQFAANKDYQPYFKLAWLLAVLKGQPAEALGARWFPAFPEGNSRGRLHFGNGLSVGWNGTYGSMNLGREALLDGFELICRLSHPTGDITLDNPPIVRSVNDLQRVSQYIDLLANTIRSRASMSVFANVPRVAVDGLREESASGAYPKFGGDYGEALAMLRSALIKIREAGIPLANEIQQFGYDVRQLGIVLQKHRVATDLSQLRFAAMMPDQMASCMITLSSLNFGSVFGCANSIAQINFASGIAELEGRSAELDSDLAVADFGSQFATRATNMQSLSLELAEAQEALDAGLARVETLRNEARSSLARAVYLSSFQAEHQAEVTTVASNLFDGKQRRYMEALSNARRMAFLAKRAIEQRLGVRLVDMTEDLPLVEAPATWEGSVCTFTGLSFDTLKQASPNASESFANGFISDYVTRLENTIESYRLENNFHEGTDTAVISLRDDLLNVRAECDAPVGNLLYHAGQLDTLTSPGWAIEGCATEIVEGQQVPGLGCVKHTRLPLSPLPDDTLFAQVVGYELEFDSGTAVLVQSTDLEPGTYRFSWYTLDVPAAGGSTAGFVESDPPITMVDSDHEPTEPDGWHREFRVFTVPNPAELDAVPHVRIGFRRPGVPEQAVRVAAPLLERLPDVDMDFALTPFTNTGFTLTRKLPVCEDTAGDSFRAKHWIRRCVRLCADGFSSDCGGEQAESYCFREATFSINQRDIQLGKVMNFSGFARGNFNYRMESVGVNFVGTGTRACGEADLPSTCFSAGYVPYSIHHNGPFFVRNHLGADFEALLFDGRIEHARGLAAERYLTNPLSSADQQLINQYLRREFQGRPLDGSFVIRVWEEPGVVFEGIEDVQLVLNYRYWTPFD